MKKFITFLFLLAGTNCLSYAQTASITGKVTGEKTLEPLAGTIITVVGTNIKTQTDANGNFAIKNIAAGQKQLQFSNIAYETKILQVNPSPVQVLVLEVQLTLKGEDLGEVKVSSRGRRVSASTVNSVLSEQKLTKAVVSGISRQQMALSQDNNAAQVMQRVPGVTITDNRFVMIRGLAERYNNVMINDVVAPSTEVDKRTFSFDLIPSNALDRMMVFKSASPENPGDFAGGVIKLYTNNSVEKPFTELSFGIGYRQNTSFRPYFQSEGSSTDLFGFDNGYRNLPSNFASTRRLQESSRSSNLRERAGRMLPNNWNPMQSTAMPDFKFGLNFGRRFNIGRIKATNITAFEISQSFQHYQRDFHRYFEYDIARPNVVDPRFNYVDDVYEKNNRITLMSNFTFQINNKNTIRFSNLFNQIGENETNLRQGEDYIQTLGWRRHYMLGYRSRSIYSGQFEGTHNINVNNKLRWVLGGSFLYENEPDLRRFRTYAAGGSATPKDNFTMITPPSSNLFDVSRYYGNLLEFSINNGFDYVKSLGGAGKYRKELKLGYYVDYRYRDFSSRYFSFLIPGNISLARKTELENQPLTTIFSRANISANNGYVIEEGTRPQDSYDASNFLTAGYVSVSIPMEKINISGGIRAENNLQTLNSANPLGKVNVNNPVLSILPSLNLIYEFSETSQIRLGYGRTINRPEFRELAPFLFYDYKLDAARIGNPNLKTATIDNIDLRYEYYPRSGETISFGLFYKNFKNPIENTNIITTEQPSFTYSNAQSAYNYGAELEIRKSLDQYFKTGILSKMSVNLNATYINSQVDLGSVASAQTRVRRLQGQSPYIINLGTNYHDTKRNLIVSASYNIFGSRIFAVGDLNNPDIYELPRHSLDVTLTKNFQNFTLKAGIQDLLNFRYRFVQDTDRNASPYDALDKTIFGFRRGTLLNISFSYKLK